MKSLYESILDIDNNIDKANNDIKHTQKINNEFGKLIIDLLKGYNVNEFEIAETKNTYQMIFNSYTHKISDMDRSLFEDRFYQFYEGFKKIEKDFKEIWGIEQKSNTYLFDKTTSATMDRGARVITGRNMLIEIGFSVYAKQNKSVVGISSPLQANKNITIMFSKNMLDFMENVLEKAGLKKKIVLK